MDIIKFKRKMVSELSGYEKVVDSSIDIINEEESEIYIIFEYPKYDIKFDICFDMLTAGSSLSFYEIQVVFYFEKGRWTTSAYIKANEYNCKWRTKKCCLHDKYIEFCINRWNNLWDEELNNFPTHELMTFVTECIKEMEDFCEKYQFEEESESSQDLPE